MAEEHLDSRPINFRQWLPWLEIFRGFQVAVDYKKLLLAAAGILVMATWWWFWSLVFYKSRDKPEVSAYPTANYQPTDNTLTKEQIEQAGKEKAWTKFRDDRRKWDLLHEAAGTEVVWTDAGDLADNLDDYNAIIASPAYKEVMERIRQGDGSHRTFTLQGRVYEMRPKPYGKLSTWPWFEDRGPNQYLLVAGKVHPWQEGQFASWFVSNQVPVLIEPLVKFMRPVFYFFHPPVGFWNYIYLTIVLVGTLAIWALFGGMITRMAAVQIARREKIGISEAFRFTWNRWTAFFSAPLIPLGIILVIVLLTILYGAFHLIPFFGDIVVDGLLWWLILVAGFAMTVLLIGLVGWPMMYATISAEGSDSFDALSRSYSYVYQNPWSYLWYAVVALVYGMVLIFFVGLFGSLTVFLGKWGVSQTPAVDWLNRNPNYLFVYAPEAYGWRDLLMQDSPAWKEGAVQPELLRQYFLDNPQMHWWNRVGAFLVSVWLYLVFLLVLGFGYSYFWTASTVIYLLMRRKVDDTELDEVFLEEEEPEHPYTEPPPEEKAEPGAEHVPGPVHAAPAVTMVEPPALKPSAPVVAEPAPARSDTAANPMATPTATPPREGDGSPSAVNPNP
jgi:hypothetical protein